MLISIIPVQFWYGVPYTTGASVVIQRGFEEPKNLVRFQTVVKKLLGVKYMYAVGDIHGRLNDVMDIIEFIPNNERIVWVGDWFDSFDRKPIEQIHSLETALKRSNENNDSDIFILGNHDNHYLNDLARGSGYQETMRDAIQNLLTKNFDKFKIVHYENGILFSHGGIIHQFLDEFEKYAENLAVLNLNHINDIFSNKMSWNKDNPIFWISHFRGGWNEFSGPLWCDWRELVTDFEKNGFIDDKITQVVGHTSFAGKNGINNFEEGKLYCIDCLDSVKQILHIDDITNEISIVSL